MQRAGLERGEEEGLSQTSGALVSERAEAGETEVSAGRAGGTVEVIRRRTLTEEKRDGRVMAGEAIGGQRARAGSTHGVAERTVIGPIREKRGRVGVGGAVEGEIGVRDWEG